MTDQTLAARVAALEAAHRELVELLLDNKVISEVSPPRSRLLSSAVVGVIERAQARLADLRSG